MEAVRQATEIGLLPQLMHQWKIRRQYALNTLRLRRHQQLCELIGTEQSLGLTDIREQLTGRQALYDLQRWQGLAVSQIQPVARLHTQFCHCLGRQPGAPRRHQEISQSISIGVLAGQRTVARQTQRIKAGQLNAPLSAGNRQIQAALHNR